MQRDALSALRGHAVKPIVLAVDDDSALLRLLEVALMDEGYDVVTASSVQDARLALEGRKVDLCIFDLNLPDGNGISLVRDLRTRTSIGIIILSGKGDEMDQVIGLEVGADDYIVKPFSVRELRARVNAVLRRSHGHSLSATTIENGRQAVEKSDFTFGSHRVDLAARRVTNGQGSEITLTAMEFDALVVFLRHPDQVMTRDQIMTEIRGQDWAVYDRTIDGLVSRLRNKLRHADGREEFIETVFGIGYCYRPPNHPKSARRGQT